jgi:hypothetical protein
MGKKDERFVITQMTREARNQLRLLWVLDAPEFEQRVYLSKLISHIYEKRMEKRKRTEAQK